MVNPCPGYDVSTAFKKAGKLWSLGWHTGQDREAPRGTPIVAAAPGKVAKVAWDEKNYGQYVVINHDPIDGVIYQSWSCHMPEGGATVEAGDRVTAGQRIGSVSDTGNATGPHLHFEVRIAPFTFSAKTFVDPNVLTSYDAQEAPVSEVYYPKADRKVQDFSKDYPGSAQVANCIALHTTETTGWPGYGGGASGPHVTVQPDMDAKRLLFRQHLPSNRSARALENRPDGVETNTFGVFQVELGGTCDWQKSQEWTKDGVEHIYWPEAPAWALEALADLLRWFDANHPKFVLKDAAPRGWAPYRLPNGQTAGGSYGLTAKQRMTAKEWEGCYGVVGHQHVPENSHGDPGAFPIAELIAAAKGDPSPTTPPVVAPPVVVPEPPASTTELTATFCGMNIYSSAYAAWAGRKADLKATFLDKAKGARASVYLLSEVNNDADHAMVMSILGSGFQAVRALGNNHIYYDVDKWELTYKNEFPLGSTTRQARRVTVAKLRHRATGIVVFAWVSHLSSATQGSNAEQADASRKTEARNLVKIIKREAGDLYDTSIGYLDGNSATWSEGGVKDIIRDGGLIEMAKLGITIGDGQLNSHHTLGKRPDSEGEHIDHGWFGKRVVVKAARQIGAWFKSSDHLARVFTVTIRRK